MIVSLYLAGYLACGFLFKGFMKHWGLGGGGLSVGWVDFTLPFGVARYGCEGGVVERVVL